MIGALRDSDLLFGFSNDKPFGILPSIELILELDFGTKQLKKDLWWSLPLEGRRGRRRSGCGGPVVWSVVIRFPGDRGLHRSVDAGFISEGWRLRQLRRRRSSFRDVKVSLTSVYSLRVEEGKASMIAVLLVGSSACFEFRRS
ncbi:hypothetical protein Bca4012_007256 [Brassica carinata]